MRAKINNLLIAAGIIIVVAAFAGCVSDGFKKVENFEQKTVNLSSDANTKNTSSINETKTGTVQDSFKEETKPEKNETILNKTTASAPEEKNNSKNENPYGGDAKYISHDPVMIYGSLPESREIGYMKEDKVIFKFLYYPTCPVCNGAKPYVPMIKEEFGERIIVEEMVIYDKPEEKWKNAAKEQIGAERFPFTLSIGMNSLDGGEIDLNLISYTDGFSAGTYDLWKKNICSQFRDKPKNCK